MSVDIGLAARQRAGASVALGILIPCFVVGFLLFMALTPMNVCVPRVPLLPSDLVVGVSIHRRL
jgi:uncharacterized membrane protein YadS